MKTASKRRTGRKTAETATAAEQWVTHSPEETRAAASSLLSDLPRKAVLALYGPLGSGKTCFVQGLARALGVKRPVTSPSFTIVNEYQGQLPVYHFDLYRLMEPDEILAVGLEEYLERDGITVIEWADRAGNLIPRNAIRLYFDAQSDPDTRVITIERPVA